MQVSLLIQACTTIPIPFYNECGLLQAKRNSRSFCCNRPSHLHSLQSSQASLLLGHVANILLSYGCSMTELFSKTHKDTAIQAI